MGLAALAACGPLAAQARYQPVLDRLAAVSGEAVTGWKTHAELPHGEDPGLDDSSWTPVTLGGRGGAAAGGEWYRATITIPAQLAGHSVAGERVRLMLRLRGDGRVFFNGSLVEQKDASLLGPVLINEKAEPGAKILVAVNTPMHATRGGLMGAELLFDRPGDAADPSLLRSEFQYLDILLAGMPQAVAQRATLDRAAGELKTAGDDGAFDPSLRNAANDLAELKPWLQHFQISAIGNAHIDMAWLWPWTETVEVVRDTFTTVLQLMNEYPDFKYTQSSAVDFAWLEDKYPELFRQIQQRVKEGRWEIVGGMWVEPDLNLPDGESQVRQLLVGKEYFQQAFGVNVNIGWNPDTFGYNWQLPQIYEKSGVDFFVTQKLVWGEAQSGSPYHFPYRLFWWRAPDGSQVLTYFPHSYSNTMTPPGMMRDLAAYSATDPPGTGVPDLMYLYGVGDHGGGPTRTMLDQAELLRAPESVAPKFVFSTAHDFFAGLEQRIQAGLKVPTWNDELYMVYHRGVYTTQSETKKEERSNEELLQNTEKFSALALLDDRPYPQADLLDLWKRLLFDQFHDIMPGSGLGINYKDAAENLEYVHLQGERLLHAAASDLAARVDTAGVGTAVVVFNPLSFARTAAVTVEAEFPVAPRYVAARDSGGAPLPAQVLHADPATHRAAVRVLVRNVPPLGYEVIHLRAAAAPPAAASPVRVHGLTLENAALRVVIDPKTGCVTSLFDKTDQRESLAPGACGNLLQKIVDIPAKQDAWEIASDGPETDLVHPSAVSLVESGPVQATVRVVNAITPASTITEDLTLTAGVPRLDIRATVEMHDHHILIKAAVPTNVHSAFASYEIPYGSIQRPTTRNNDREKSEFEVPAERWGDLSDASHGVSLLNASKYGYDALGNVIRLSLLRTPTNPDPEADIGHHEFTYALYPHAGDWKAGGTMQQGYDLNFPLLAYVTASREGGLPARHSFAGIEPGNVILTVVKKAEGDNALVFRYYEFAGKAAAAKIHLPQRAVKAVATNLMEQGEQPLALSADGMEVTVPTTPYSINTIKVWFANMPTPAAPPARAHAFAPGPG